MHIISSQLAGSLAESGRPLDEILSVCQSATANMGEYVIQAKACMGFDNTVKRESKGHY